jgi:transposase
MITVPAGLRVLIATKPVDFRKGADGLAALVRETLATIHSQDRFMCSARNGRTV